MWIKANAFRAKLFRAELFKLQVATDWDGLANIFVLCESYSTHNSVLAATQLAHYSVKMIMDNASMNECDKVHIKLYLQTMKF